jgi:hypothetical protein
MEVYGTAAAARGAMERDAKEAPVPAFL